MWKNAESIMIFTLAFRLIMLKYFLVRRCSNVKRGTIAHKANNGARGMNRYV